HRRRPGPLFKDYRTGISALDHSFEEPLDASAVPRRRAGEERQMAVGVAPVFMHVEVDDRHVRLKPIDVPQVMVARAGAKVGVAEIQAHADVWQFGRSEALQLVKQLVEL